MNIILFGEIGAGKDTVAEIISKNNFIVAKLGKEIRETVDANCRLMKIPKDLHRTKYVEFGQGMRRIFGEDLWCNKLIARHEKDIIKQRICIADARQTNEFDFFVNGMSFIPVAVIADEPVRRQRVVERDGYDQSKNKNEETEVQVRKSIELVKAHPQGIVITNNSSIQELEFQLQSLLLDKNRKL